MEEDIIMCYIGRLSTGCDVSSETTDAKWHARNHTVRKLTHSKPRRTHIHQHIHSASTVVFLSLWISKFSKFLSKFLSNDRLIRPPRTMVVVQPPRTTIVVYPPKRIAVLHTLKTLDRLQAARIFLLFLFAGLGTEGLGTVGCHFIRATGQRKRKTY
jgi:hypothetical protein